MGNSEIAEALRRGKSILWCEVVLEGTRLLAAGRTHATALDEQSFVNWNGQIELNCDIAEAHDLRTVYKVWTVDAAKIPVLIGEYSCRLETRSHDSAAAIEPSSVKLSFGPICARVIEN